MSHPTFSIAHQLSSNLYFGLPKADFLSSIHSLKTNEYTKFGVYSSVLYFEAMLWPMDSKVEKIVKIYMYRK